MILDNNFGPNSTEVLNLGYSDHLGQILTVSMIKQEYNPVILKKRNFSQRNMTHFKDLLYRDEWTEVYTASFLNDAHLAFLDRFLDCLNAAFPVKLYKQKKIHNNGWITSGMKKSGQRMRLLNDLKHTVNLSKNALYYIKRYQKTYKQVISFAKKTV
jgi:hypothetical protein